MALKLYEEAGWLNIPAIASLGRPFNVLIGPRQCGKSYGLFKYFLTKGVDFLFTRRTPTELDTCLTGKTSTFKPICEDLGITYNVVNDSQYIRRVDFYREGESHPYCNALCVALTSVAKIRGFSARGYKEWAYDEFIPEVTVRKMNGEGDAYVNAYITINGNRELNGEPPIRAWLLANSNDLFSPVLAELGLSEKVENMVKKDQEYADLPDRGCIIVLPKAKEITSKRAQTALYKLTGVNTDAARMALNNEFAYSNVNDVVPQDLNDYVCKFYIGIFGVWRNKTNPSIYYVCKKVSGAPQKVNTASTRGINKILSEMGYEDFIDRIYKGEVLFSDYATKRSILSLLNKPIL